MDEPHRITLAEMRQTTRNVAAALESAGSAEHAARLREAIRSHGSDAEDLLTMRSALVATRNRWEGLAEPALVASARRALGAAKRLAIDL